MKALGQEVQADVSEAAHDSDPIKFAMAPFVGATRVLLKGGERLLLGVLDKKEPPHVGPEFTHELKETGKELATLHPLRAAVHGMNVIDGATLDIVRAMAGYRSRASHTLSSEHHSSSIA